MKITDQFKKNIIKTINCDQKNKILVLGDVILDRYLYGRVERISPEAPVPVFLIEREEYKLGGAANVAHNLKKMNIGVQLVGIAGEDIKKERLKKILVSSDIDHCLIVVQGFLTIEKTRILAQNQHLLRLDRENAEPSLRRPKGFYQLLGSKFISHDLVIISDYAKGMIDERIMELLSELDIKVLLDPKVKNKDLYRSVYMMTPNMKEAEELSGIKNLKGNKERLILAGDFIKQKYGLKNLLLTLGPDGMLLFEEIGSIIHIPAIAKKIYDVTGAGDTVISILGFGLASGLSELESSFLANVGASEVVGDVGTSYVTREKCLSLMGDIADQIQLSQWR